MSVRRALVWLLASLTVPTLRATGPATSRAGPRGTTYGPQRPSPRRSCSPSHSTSRGSGGSFCRVEFLTWKFPDALGRDGHAVRGEASRGDGAPRRGLGTHVRGGDAPPSGRPRSARGVR